MWGLESTKELVFGVSESLSDSLLYSGAREVNFLDLLKRAIFFPISWMISLDNHERFCLLGIEVEGMHLCMISRNTLHQLFQEIVTWVAINKDVGGVKVAIGEKFIC